MRILRSTPFGLGFLFLSACGPANAPTSLTARAPVVSRITHAMPPGSSSTASIHTLPNSTCQVTVGGQDKSMRLFADDQGVARLQLDHLDPSVTHGEVAMTCIDDTGAVAQHAIDVVIDDSAAAAEPEPYNRAGKPTLAKLDVDAASLTNADIIARHYPPRPDAATQSAQYATWMKLVGSEPTVIEPHVVVEPERTHAQYTGTSNNWSGYVLSNPHSSTYAWIYGEWNVPRAYAESGFWSSDHSSFWVGLDGSNGSSDVVQDGTDSDTLTAFWVQTSSYDAWIEWYPLSSESVSNFPVSPGDDIHAWTWMRDPAGNWDSAAKSTVGWFYMWNATQNYYVYWSINEPGGTTFQGNTAEWVLERPTVDGSLSSLANYSYAQLSNALAYDVAGGSHLYNGDSTDNSSRLTMTGNNNAALSTVAPINSTTMAFTYHGHD